MSSSKNAKSQKLKTLKTLLPFVGYFILMCYSIANSRRAHPPAHYSLLALCFLLYCGVHLAEYFNSVYRRLPPREKSLRKFLLKLTMWLYSTVIMAAMVWQYRAFLSPVEALPLYVITVGGSALLFYAYFIYDDGESCSDKGCAEEEKCALFVEESNAVCEKV